MILLVTWRRTASNAGSSGEGSPVLLKAPAAVSGWTEAALPGAAIAESIAAVCLAPVMEAAGPAAVWVVAPCAASAAEPATVAVSPPEQLASAAVEAAVAGKLAWCGAAPVSEGPKVAAAAAGFSEAMHSSAAVEVEAVTAICWTAATRSLIGGRGASLSEGWSCCKMV